MTQNVLRQSELAADARMRGERREVSIGESKTAFWFYPAEFGSATSQSVVMIHGYRGNHHGLEAIAGALRNLDVYIPDLPGFGESQPSASGHTITNYADWLDVFIRELKLSAKPHLLGHSFGSIVVSAYAAEYAGIASLILENPVSAPALKGRKSLATAAAKSFFRLAALLPESLGESLLKSWPMVRGMSIVMTKSRDGNLRRWIHAQHDANFNDFATRAVALEGYAASVSNCVRDYSANFSVPVLMLIGERDDITSVEEQQNLHRSIELLPSHLVQFERVGHLTHYEVPEDVANAIEMWIAELHG